MTYYNQQHEGSESFRPPPSQAFSPAKYPPGPFVAAPPPIGYPIADASHNPHQIPPEETRTRGDGFLKGCFAGLCCCWVLDCFF